MLRGIFLASILGLAWVVAWAMPQYGGQYDQPSKYDETYDDTDRSYTETFYVCEGGDGTLPELATCGTAYDAADFNTAGNWDTDVSDDGNIGPGDRVIFLDDGGTIRATPAPQASGLAGSPITIEGEPGGSPVVSGADAFTSWTQSGNEYYSGGLTWNPGSVWFEDDTMLTQGAGAGALNEQEWVRDANNLYVRLTGNADPTGSSVEATRRTRVIDPLSAAYITFKNFRVDKSSSLGVATSFAEAGGTNVILDGLDVSYAGNDGILVGTSSGVDTKPTNWVIRNCTIRKWGREAASSRAIRMYEGDGAGGDGLLIRNNTITSDKTGTDTNGAHNGIHLATGDNIVIEGNEITLVEHGIQLDGSGAGGSVETLTIRYNNIHDTSDDGIWFNGTAATDIQVYYNLLTNNADNAIDVNTADGGVGYNNTIYGSYNESVILQGSDGTQMDLKNNIILEWGAGTNAEAIGVAAPVDISDSVLDFNIYYKDGSSNVAHLLYTHKTLAAWKTDASQDASTVSSDARLVAPASDDFRLGDNSPAIDAGTDVSLVSDYARNKVGPNPDIGAYEYVP